MYENEKPNLTESEEEFKVVEKSKLPALALSFNGYAVVFFVFGLGMLFLGMPLSFLGLLLLLAAICCPFVAVILGIWSLCLGKRRIGNSGIVCSVFAIVIPIIFVTVMIILFSTGVAYIRWM